MDTAYVYGTGRLSLDRFDGSTGYYLYDPKGSVTGITNGDGQICRSYRYGAFGEITYGAPQYENIYAYNGESYNPNVGSLYLMLMYGKEASNRKQEIDRQHHTILNQRTKDQKTSIMEMCITGYGIMDNSIHRTWKS